jgi:polar amino acid transport system substrate-binding protein
MRENPLFFLRSRLAVRRVLIGLVGFAAALAVSAAPAVAQSDLQAVKQRGKLVMLCFPQQGSPFVHAMVDELGEKGLNVFGGTDVVLLRRFATELGVELEVRPVREAIADMIPALLRREGDLVANALGITEKRRKYVDFSLPYISAKEGLVVRKDSGLKSVADLKGKAASTMSGSSHEDVLLRLAIPDLKIQYVDFSTENYQVVLEKKADFTILDADSAASAIAKVFDLKENLEIVQILPEEAHYGIALRPGSDLLPLLDAYLTKLKASGDLEKILSGQIK